MRDAVARPGREGRRNCRVLVERRLFGRVAGYVQGLLEVAERAELRMQR